MRRNTNQCALVLQAVRTLRSHATAEEVYQAVIRQDPRVSRATVYRNLNKLCDQDLIKKRYIPGDAERYDHICSDHYHAKCLKCGKIFDVDMEVLPDLPQTLQGLPGFKVIGHSITFTGYCPDCQQDS